MPDVRVREVEVVVVLYGVLGPEGREADAVLELAEVLSLDIDVPDESPELDGFESIEV